MQIDLPYELALREYQQSLWQHMMQDLPHLRACAIWPRRNGKDLICLNILIAKAIQRRGLYLYIAPFQTQVRLIIWLGMTAGGKKFLDYIPPALLKDKWDSRMECELINGSLIKLIGADNYDSKMGAGAAGAVFTEYSLQRPDAWNYIRPMIRETGGFALFNYTARGLNHGHKMHTMAKMNPKWFHQYLTCLDTGFPTQEDIQEERDAGMKESLIQQEYYNDWNASTEETFIPLDLIAPCVLPEAELKPSEYEFEPVIFGCDVAYAAKGDKATLCCRQGRKIHFLRWYQGMDNQAFADEIARFSKIWKPDTINIDAGRGEGVISRLDRLTIPNVNPVHFGGKVYEEGIANMKALMWLRTMEWFMEINHPDMTNLDTSKYANEEVEEQLVTELSLPFMERDEKNQIKVESKASLKTRGESSPDLAESVTLTHALEIHREDCLTPRQKEMGMTQEMVELAGQMTEETYDPLTYMDSLMSGGAP